MCESSVFKRDLNSNCKTKEVRRDGSLLLLNCYVSLALPPQLSVFLMLCIINTILHFLICQ